MSVTTVSDRLSALAYENGAQHVEADYDARRAWWTVSLYRLSPVHVTRGEGLTLGAAIDSLERLLES